MAARCETVLNITMAEMDTYHTQKQEDFQALAKEHLDGEIALYEQASPGLVSQPVSNSPAERPFKYRSFIAYTQRGERSILHNSTS